MDIALTDEQRMLVDVASDLAGRLAPGDLRDLPATELAPGSRAVLVESGWLGLRAPQHAGGADAGCLDLALVAEQLGRRLSVAPFAGPTMAVELLRVAGAPGELFDRYGAAGRLATIALDATLADVATAPVGAVAFDSAGAEVALLCRDGRVVALPVGAPRRRVVDLTRQCADVSAADDGEETGRSPSDDSLDRVRALGLVLLSADLLGVMSAALDAAVEHAKTRAQFGRPIGSFQAVQHLLAEAHVSVEATRSAVWYAGWAVDELPVRDALTAARVAKAHASAAGVEVCEQVVQVFGGMGFTWESQASAWLRRAHLDRRVLGDESAQYRALAGRFIPQPLGRPDTSGGHSRGLSRL